MSDIEMACQYCGLVVRGNPPSAVQEMLSRHQFNQHHDQMSQEAADQIAREREDVVNHPSHYTSHPSGIECIEVVRHFGFNIGCAVKYLWRAGLKDEGKLIEDLEKAVWYIEDEIAKRKGEQDV